MEAAAAAERFTRAFHEVFMTFQRRGQSTSRELTFEALGVLEHLIATGPVSVGEAARHFERSQSATSEIVMRLARRGLVRRFADERDRRRHLVWLTDKGLETWRDSQRVLDESRLAAALATMPARRRQELVRALERVVGGQG